MAECARQRKFRLLGSTRIALLPLFSRITGPTLIHKRNRSNLDAIHVSPFYLCDLLIAAASRGNGKFRGGSGAADDRRGWTRGQD
jgi:hypothetical protein